MPPAIDERVHIGHAHLKVSDLERSIAFYHGVLGFEITQRWGKQAVLRRTRYLLAADRHRRGVERGADGGPVAGAPRVTTCLRRRSF